MHDLAAVQFAPPKPTPGRFPPAALPGLALSVSDFDMAGHAPQVGPVEAEQFGSAESGQSPKGEDRPHRAFGSFDQRPQLVGLVELHFAAVGSLGAHRLGFAEAMRGGQVVFADGPLQELPDSRPAMIAALDGIVFSLKRLALATAELIETELKAEEQDFLREQQASPTGGKVRLPSFRDNFKRTFKIFARVHRIFCATDFGKKALRHFAKHLNFGIALLIRNRR